MPRLFIALPLPDDIQHAVDRLCQGLPAIRWTPPEHRHITLRFVGETDEECYEEIGNRLMNVRHGAFEIGLKGVGHFPASGNPRILWAGVEPQTELNQLRRKVNRIVDTVTGERDSRKYRPHLSIGRFRAEPPHLRLISYMQRRSLFATRPFTVSDFALYSSTLLPKGAEYRIEAIYHFVTGGFEQF